MSNACEFQPLTKDRRTETSARTPSVSRRYFSWFEDEEWANGLSHAIGSLLSVAASWWLLKRIIPEATPAQIVASVVYCFSLVGVYTASTLSHWTHSPVWRQRFRQWDQGLIYLLIVGTYTPFAVTCLDGWWHLVTVLMWTIALLGFISKVVLSHRVDSVSLWIYLFLGWLPVLIVPRFLTHGPPETLVLMVAGGLAYSVGSALLANDHRMRFLHVGWHLFVILGSVLHYWAVWSYLVARS